MSRFNHRKKWSRRDYIIRITGSIFTIVLLLLFIPREGIVSYHYNIGEPWDYKTLIAQDSFPIFKSEKMLSNERDSISRYYQPYFELKPEVEAENIAALHKAFREELRGEVPAYFEAYIRSRLQEIYQAGVVDGEQLANIMSMDISEIRIYNRNESHRQYADKIYSPKTAYEYILQSGDSTLYPTVTLLRCAINRFLTVNLRYDVEKSSQQRSEVNNLIVPYMGQVLVGQKIVDRGQIIDEYTYQVLQSMESFQRDREKSSSEILQNLLGQVLFVTAVILLMLFYLQQFRSDYLTNTPTMLLMLCMLLAFPLMTYSLVRFTSISPYVLPYCMAPIFIRIFMDSRTAFAIHVCIVMLCSIAVETPVDYIIIQFAAGMTAIYSLRQLSERSEMFRAIILILFVSVIIQASLDLMHGRFMTLSSTDFAHYINIALSSLLLMVGYILLIPFERIFGFVSNVTLIELSNINNPLLRKLSEEAPGTFQHSMQVANLAADVAVKIGAKSQLVRTAALYHDIGKIRHAAFFTENQKGINPHERMTNEQSAQIIISHVKEGLAVADKFKLPQAIKEFIATHHGTSMVRYFYVQAQNKSPEQEIDRSLFMYSGPNPTTAEQAILMMADSVEAASRSLQEYTEEAISELVDKIIDLQVSGGYFKYCAITFLDIATAKDIFKTKLKTIYHTRIQYPELKTQSTS